MPAARRLRNCSPGSRVVFAPPSLISTIAASSDPTVSRTDSASAPVTSVALPSARSVEPVPPFSITGREATPFEKPYRRNLNFCATRVSSDSLPFNISRTASIRRRPFSSLNCMLRESSIRTTRLELRGITDGMTITGLIIISKSSSSKETRSAISPALTITPDLLLIRR